MKDKVLEKFVEEIGNAKTSAEIAGIVIRIYKLGEQSKRLQHKQMRINAIRINNMARIRAGKIGYLAYLYRKVLIGNDEFIFPILNQIIIDSVGISGLKEVKKEESFEVIPEDKVIKAIDKILSCSSFNRKGQCKDKNCINCSLNRDLKKELKL